MNHKLICLSLLLLGLLLQVQCTKKPVQPTGKTESLVRVWKMNQVLINGQQDLGTNYSSWLWEFRSGGQYSFSQNGQVKGGRWEMTANNQQIVLDPNSASQQVMRIMVLTDTELELEAEMAADYKTGARTMTYKLIP
jgi:hypothetical protein